MDILRHDILAFTGAADHGLAHAKSANVSSPTRKDSNQSGLLDPLRRLLRHPYQALGSVYSSTADALPDGTLDSSQDQEFRVQALRHRLRQVRRSRVV